MNDYTRATPSPDFEILAMFLVAVGLFVLASTSGNTPWVIDVVGKLVSAAFTGA